MQLQPILCPDQPRRLNQPAYYWGSAHKSKPSKPECQYLVESRKEVSPVRKCSLTPTQLQDWHSRVTCDHVLFELSTFEFKPCYEKVSTTKSLYSQLLSQFPASFQKPMSVEPPGMFNVHRVGGSSWILGQGSPICVMDSKARLYLIRMGMLSNRSINSLE